MMTRVKTTHTILLECASLQILDLISTLLFLAHGVLEANPLVKWSMTATHSPILGLVAVKCVAAVLAMVAVKCGRPSVLVKMNRFFAFLVAWNVLSLGISAVGIR